MVAIFMVAGMGEGQADSIFRKFVSASVVGNNVFIRYSRETILPS